MTDDAELAERIRFQREAIQENKRVYGDGREGVGKIQMDGSASPEEQAAAIVAEDTQNAPPTADLADDKRFANLEMSVSSLVTSLSTLVGTVSALATVVEQMQKRQR